MARRSKGMSKSGLKRSGSTSIRTPMGRGMQVRSGKRGRKR